MTKFEDRSADWTGPELKRLNTWISAAEQDYALHDPDAALNALDEAEKLARELNDSRLLSILRRQFEISWEVADVGRAESALQEWVTVSREASAFHDLAKGLVMLAFFPMRELLSNGAVRREMVREAEQLSEQHGFSDVQEEIRARMAIFNSAGVDPFEN